VIASEDLPVEVACRVLGVSCAGYYAWRLRPPSARAVRHAWLSDVIREVHAASYGCYGAKRVHAELVLGRSIRVGHNAVAMLMRRAGIAGRTGSPKRRGLPGCGRQTLTLEPEPGSQVLPWERERVVAHLLDRLHSSLYHRTGFIRLRMGTDCCMPDGCVCCDGVAQTAPTGPALSCAIGSAPDCCTRLPGTYDMGARRYSAATGRFLQYDLYYSAPSQASARSASALEVSEHPQG
jgi:hypothetical protein